VPRRQLNIGPWITVEPTLRGLNQFTSRLSTEELFSSVRGSLLEVLQELQRDIVYHTPEASGDTREGIKVEVNGTSITNLSGRVYSEDEYFRVLEFGRRIGAKAPPEGAIRRWMQDVGIDDPPGGGIVFLIQRAIKRRGLPAYYMMRGALERQRPHFKTVFIRRFLEDWYGRH
jgi:hypothetical protein